MRLVNLRALEREAGSAMVLVVFLSAALLLLSVSLIDVVRGDASQSTRGVTRDTAFHAAEAGIDDYLSKMLDDNQYYLHDVAVGESTRQASGGEQVSPGSSTPTAWPYGTTWTYPNGKNNWRSLSNGYEYNLQVTGPTSSTPYLDIIATGRRQGTTAPLRVLQERVRPASIADFQMISAVSVSYGSTASTFGKIYSGGSVTHSGTAYADIYAENQASGTTTMVSPAKKYDVDSSPTIRTKIKNPISFTSFAGSLADIQRAAELSGLSFDDATKDAWQFAFNSDGTFSVSSCMKTSVGGVPKNIEIVPPTCGSPTTYTMPTNGAIYVAQSMVVAGGTSTCTDPVVGTLSNASCANGRVTVASNGTIVIGDDMGYVESGDDVLGLIAKNEMIVALWAPTNITWRAATISQTGQWRSAMSSTTSISGGSITLPKATITVGSTANFAPNTTQNFSPGTIMVGSQTVTCTGSDATHFTGCTGGSGSIANGTSVTQSNVMTFTGSTATAGGGFMNMFRTRLYQYDTTLTYLQPPWFPTIDYAYTVLFFRELPPG